MILILRPRMPPASLIWALASFSDSIEPVSEIAMVPVAECRMPQVTSVSVTARPVVLIADVAGTSAKDGRGSIVMAGNAAIPMSSLRRSGDCRPRLISSDMSTPFLFEDALLVRLGLLKLCSAQIRKIAYIAPQNSDVGFEAGLAGGLIGDRLRRGVQTWQGGSG